MKAETLRVPGANLYYQVQGSRPVLLMISAGAGDADCYNGLASYLTGTYMVVSYDRRGYARSPQDDPNQLIEIGTHSEDAHWLLAALGSQPAYVFGCSIGALIGLDLVVHHAEQVSSLVAHEPPVEQLLPEEERPASLPDM